MTLEQLLERVPVKRFHVLINVPPLLRFRGAMRRSFATDPFEPITETGRVRPR